MSKTTIKLIIREWKFGIKSLTKNHEAQAKSNSKLHVYASIMYYKSTEQNPHHSNRALTSVKQ